MESDDRAVTFQQPTMKRNSSSLASCVEVGDLKNG